jgi:hypothetical protein
MEPADAVSWRLPQFAAPIPQDDHDLTDRRHSERRDDPVDDPLSGHPSVSGWIIVAGQSFEIVVAGPKAQATCRTVEVIPCSTFPCN